MLMGARTRPLELVVYILERAAALSPQQQVAHETHPVLVR
jgi:hypothetical protein